MKIREQMQVDSEFNNEINLQWRAKLYRDMEFWEMRCVEMENENRMLREDMMRM